MLLNWASSLRGKLFLVLASLGITSLTSTLLGSLWVTEESIIEIQQQTKSSLAIASELVSINAEAALLFKDKEMAKRLLSSLANEPVVAGALMKSAAGEEMAIYLREPTYRSPLLRPDTNTTYNIIYSEKFIVRHNELIGKISIIADISKVTDSFFWRLITVFSGLSLLLIILLSLLILFLNHFNKRLSRLTLLTQEIHDQKNFDRRLVLSGKDELTAYSDRFNAMLDVIQIQTSELEVFNLQLAQQTLHDNMTGLPNRSYYKIKIKQMLNDYHELNICFSLISFDIDYFKKINDRFGHQTGDEVINIFAEELKRLSTEHTFFSRIGGDEFVGLYQNDPSGNFIKKLYGKINTNFQKKMTLRLGKEQYTCSAGIACLPNDSLNIRDLMKLSDVALYHAKRTGRNKVTLFKEATRTPNPPLHMHKQHSRTFNANNVRPVFQPIYNAQYSIIGIECLATYNEPHGNVENAVAFIPWLEEEGLISLLDHAMFDKSLHEGRRIRESEIPNLMLFHNFSLDTIALPDFPQRIKNTLQKHRFPPENLVLEVTETIQLNNTTIQHLKIINDFGCILCIDDFGAGFTHPGYFRKLPWGMVKIDKEYIRNINEPMSQKLINSLFKIAQLMKIRVVAEGVEKIEDLKLLEENNCDFFQGYYFSHPTPSIMVRNQQQDSTPARNCP